MNSDFWNGLFEAGGAILAWRNAYQLYKDKEVKGVYWPIYFFYSAWGLWNLWYYRALGQYLSWYAGMILVLGNILWLYQAAKLWLRRRELLKWEYDMGDL